jgi:hypothetical protein
MPEPKIHLKEVIPNKRKYTALDQKYPPNPLYF